VPAQQQEFERIAMPHLAALLRVARRLTLESAAAEDLVQQAMLLAWRGFHSFQIGTNARAWLFRILFNAFHGERRKAALSAQPVPFQDRVQPGFEEAVEIAQAIDALPLEQRTVLLMCIVEGFTCREAAEILDVPIGTVMSRLARARQDMRRSLKPLAPMREKAKEAYR
jgi:RNA polymerase sigma-70 factor (ECF subfamily)